MVVVVWFSTRRIANRPRDSSFRTFLATICMSCCYGVTCMVSSGTKKLATRKKLVVGWNWILMTVSSPSFGSPSATFISICYDLIVTTCLQGGFIALPKCTRNKHWFCAHARKDSLCHRVTLQNANLCTCACGGQIMTMEEESNLYSPHSRSFVWKKDERFNLPL